MGGTMTGSPLSSWRGRLDSHVPRYPDLSDRGRSIIITNSERSTAACPLRHWYRHSLGLDDPRLGVSAAAFGTGFHDVMESLFCHVRDTDSYRGSLSVIEEATERVIGQWADQVSGEELSVASQRLRSIVEAWVRRFNLGALLEEFRVLYVEKAFTTPIVHPETGKQVRASMRVADDVDESGAPILRLAMPGDEKWKRVQWPWLFAGRCDVVLESRSTGKLWIMDHKTTNSPSSLISTLSTDPQSSSYAWLVSQALGRPVAGFIWNIVDSAAPSDVRILKNGKMSTASRQRVPGWKVRDYLELRKLDEGIDPSPEELAFAEEQSTLIDHRYAWLEQWGVSQNETDLAAIEIYADALRIARLYRDGLIDDRLALASTHPRVPVCKAKGAFCSYRGPCSRDGELARMNFEIRPHRTWTRHIVSDRAGPDQTSGEDDPRIQQVTNSGGFQW